MKKIKSLFMLCLFGMISIAASAEDIPNNQIWYEASAKLKETTNYQDAALYINAFNASIILFIIPITAFIGFLTPSFMPSKISMILSLASLKFSIAFSIPQELQR